MKKFYSYFFRITFVVFMLLYYFKPCYSQCPNGQPAGATAYDTTIAFGAGIVSTQLKFPKFDPQTGMVTCVKLCVTIKGPGIPTYLTSGTNDLSFGPFSLAATDGVFGSGPDFYSHGSDTVLTKVLCSNINDSATIAQFYGVNDSVTYSYNINASAGWSVTGGSASAFVLSSALVNFHFSYCTCPSSALPLDVYEFTVNKAASNKAHLSWNGLDDMTQNYHYEIQLSRDGSNFSTIYNMPKNFTGKPYDYIYTTSKSDNTKYYFRVKQIYANGYPRFSDVKYIELENSNEPKINIYPNPSNGFVGIKFVNVNSGKFQVQISNTQG